MDRIQEVRHDQREENSGAGLGVERESDIAITCLLVCVHVPSPFRAASVQNVKTEAPISKHRVEAGTMLGAIQQVVSKHVKVH